ncbi:BREX-1 system phosphatase PglZ type A [Leptospira ognonensis]|uniref:BREX-1 system phosphatase PglZ type A n=1 Tax=Leptospira ognonensis TaxID=2484945 RepID=A0A4V3JR80_9LEPT|nr:BREX-1 system phosphatase PglZ type A [Leptospira ognonensis]TGL58695.1 BREX-1 system phosphatase PglZ type A [Leptospira ognonensis]
MSDKIKNALHKLFDKHRIVFWYDAKSELRDVYDSIALENIEKCEIQNNEYRLKYRLIREEPAKKFLLFHDGPQPAPLDNWLLDLLLANGEFRTDQVGLLLSELDLRSDLSEVVSEHLHFFSAIKRKESLKQILDGKETGTLLRLKMLSVCAGSEANIGSVLENLLVDLSANKDEKIRLIEKCTLSSFLWDQVRKDYNYHSNEPGLKDFAIELFKSCYAMKTEGNARLNADALVFLRRWKDSQYFRESFESLSGEYESLLGIKNDLEKRDFRKLIDVDFFTIIDRKIISSLVEQVTAETVSRIDVSDWIRIRRRTHWYASYSDLYEAIDFAAQFFQTLHETILSMDSLDDGAKRYVNQWYLLDQFYRKFIYHVKKSSQPSLLEALRDKIEKLYSNNYLLKINDRFQNFVDQTSQWSIQGIPLQKDFFTNWVKPFLSKENKICVIISDALRFEIGEELLGIIRKEDRYQADLEPMLSMLPSYTQLGMAALLPNQFLELASDDSGTVIVDGQNAKGTQNRDKILKAALSERAQAITSEDFMSYNREQSRDLFRANDVLYIYHNRIDHTGDKILSEGMAFEAAEDAMDDLTKIVKKLTAANATNILITADHGFIYQDRALEESDFSSQEPSGTSILYKHRRFVLGKGLVPQTGFKSFTSAQLGLKGDVEIQIPKSINRLRLQGSGSRFVHGGASLQEVILPVLRINKKRTSDVEVVDVDIIRGASNIISSGQLGLMLFQTSAVTEKMQARTLRLGIYTLEGELISDQHEIRFDHVSQNPRDRETKVAMILTKKASAANNKEVLLKLEERHGGTTHYVEYKSIRYQIRRSFDSDFDF